MKKYFVLPLLLTATLFLFSFGRERQTTTVPKPESVKQEMVWYSFSEGLEKAKKENKMLLVDMYTDWCGWCKHMDKRTYTDPTVIAKINANYVPVKFNPEVSGTHKLHDSTYTNIELYSIITKGRRNGYPSTYVWMSPKDEIPNFYVQSGFLEPEEFISAVLDYFVARKQGK